MKLDRIGGKGLWLYLILVFAIIQQACQPEEPDARIEIETGSIEEVGPTYCDIQGEIYELGKDGILQHGFVWSESPNPLIESSNKNELGATSDLGIYSSTIKGLSPNTTYYVKAYGTGVDQTTYGMEKSFTTTPPTVPSLHTMSAFIVGTFTAVAGGYIIHDGGAEITSRGVCWSTNRKPTIDDNCTLDGTGSGSFESELSDLDPYTIYYFKAYATNSLGTAYGEQFGLKTLWDNSVISDIDGNEYASIQIGEQVWMADNLKAIRYSDGNSIQLTELPEDWEALNVDARAYCYYDNDELAFETFGALYTWSAAMNGEESSNEKSSGVQGVCPSGWHLPSDVEWKQLEVQLGMTELKASDDGWRGWDEGGKLKETGTSLWVEPNLFATNESGFSGIPGGFRDTTGTYGSGGSFTAFWSSRGDEGTGAWLRGLHAGRGEILRKVYPRNNGFSVRCVKDD